MRSQRRIKRRIRKMSSLEFFQCVVAIIVIGICVIVFMQTLGNS